jgi:urease subunit gamma/beta
MRLTAWEEERLLIFTAAELARRHRARGLRLNQPEAVALACDAMLDAARAGEPYDAIERAGRDAVGRDELLPGVANLIDEIRLEVLMEDGPRLVVLNQPFGPGEPDGPGAVEAVPRQPGSATALERRTLTVRNESRRIVRVSSHYPFHLVNPRLAFDRGAARGFRLDLPSGADERWAPGERKDVTLVRFGGEAGSGG